MSGLPCGSPNACEISVMKSKSKRPQHNPGPEFLGSRPAATGSIARARGLAVPSPAHRTGRTGLLQTDRSPRLPAPHSAACRTDAPATLAAPPSPPTSTLARPSAFPSPYPTVYSYHSIVAIHPTLTDFHHGLLSLESPGGSRVKRRPRGRYHGLRRI